MRRRDGNAVFPSTRTRVRGRPLTPRLILSWPRVAERRYTIYFPTLRYNYTAVLVHYHTTILRVDLGRGGARRCVRIGRYFLTALALGT